MENKTDEELAHTFAVGYYGLAVTAAHPEIEAIADAADPMGRTGDTYEDIPRSRCSWPAKTADTSPATHFSSTAAATSTVSRGHPTWVTNAVAGR